MQHHSPAYGRQGQAAPPRQAFSTPGAPPGTFAPGTKIQVGSHRVVIQKYLSEGGFAHVYVVKLPKPVDGTDVAVLKRVAVPDKETLRGMRIEVETMKKLKGHRPIVRYIDSHASELKSGGYEVFLLMEFCNGGGLIDFMNTRLQHRLTEPEILQIFTDIAEGVACMHYLKPALLHRDLKVENVLITKSASGKRFKLCDFGSASVSRPAPTNVAECRSMDDDVQRHTTLQYRSPEMVDVYRKQPINEKSDIWALGVLLYKLCYYTTPFEEQGQLAILNASFRYPNHPVFSDRLKKLIGSMLRENMDARPNIYQVLQEACAMQGRKVPVPDIYSGKYKVAATTTKPSEKQPAPKAVVGASVSSPIKEKQAIPDITPMRRGRPQASPSRTQTPQSSTSKPVTSGDPFAALDAKPKPQNADELSSRFPSLDQFSLLHDKPNSFNFDAAKSPPVKPPKEMNERMAEKLADAAFAGSRQAAPSPVNKSLPAPAPKPTPSPSKATTTPFVKPSYVQPSKSEQPALPGPKPASVVSRYVSTGTMTSEPTTPRATSRPDTPEFNDPVLSDKSSYRRRPMSTQAPASFAQAQVAQPAPIRPQSQIIRPGSSQQLPPTDSVQLIDFGDTPTKPAMEREEPVVKPEPKKLSQGQFGDSFKRFEQNSAVPNVRSMSPGTKMRQRDLILLDDGPREIIGLDEDSSDDDQDFNPELRREMERLQLEEEERRVEAAQAEHRNRATSGNQSEVHVRSSTIQNRVQAWLSEDQRQAPIKRQAEGYGKYSDAATAASKPQKTPPEVRRKPLLSGVQRTNTLPAIKSGPALQPGGPASSAPASAIDKAPAKPPAPKKPGHLNNGKPAVAPKPAIAPKAQHLMAEDLPGQPVIDMSEQEKEDYIEDFSKRFPSVSAMEGARP